MSKRIEDIIDAVQGALLLIETDAIIELSETEVDCLSDEAMSDRVKLQEAKEELNICLKILQGA